MVKVHLVAIPQYVYPISTLGDIFRVERLVNVAEKVNDEFGRLFSALIQGMNRMHYGGAVDTARHMLDERTPKDVPAFASRQPIRRQGADWCSSAGH